MWAIAVRLKSERIAKAKEELSKANLFAKPYYYYKLIQAKNSF